MKVWAFMPPSKKDYSSQEALGFRLAQLTKSIRSGISRFGWSSDDINNLRKSKNRELPENSGQKFLLKIEAGYWIVHINLPEKEKCIAGKVDQKYDFDEGLVDSYGKRDFRHFFVVDTATIIEFSRNDPGVLPSVNLKPSQRYHEGKRK